MSDNSFYDNIEESFENKIIGCDNSNDIHEIEKQQLSESKINHINNQSQNCINDNCLNLKEEEISKDNFFNKDENFDQFEDLKLIKILNDYIPQNIFSDNKNNNNKSYISNKTKDNTKRQNKYKNIQNSISFNNSCEGNDQKNKIIISENEDFELYNLYNNKNYNNSFIDKAFPFYLDLEGEKEEENYTFNNIQSSEQKNSSKYISNINFQHNNSLFICPNNYTLNTFTINDYSLNNNTFCCNNFDLYDKNKNNNTFFSKKKRKRNMNIFKNENNLTIKK